MLYFPEKVLLLLFRYKLRFLYSYCSQRDMSLQPTFDFKKYKDPGEYFKAYERHESKCTFCCIVECTRCVTVNC